MHRTSELANEISRRSFLNRTMGLSLGSIALSNLAQEDNCFGSSITDLTKLQPVSYTHLTLPTIREV